MYSSAAMKQKKNTKEETCSTVEHDSFHDKRRLLSYWKSLDTCPVNNVPGNLDVNNELLVELKNCLSELDDLESLSNTDEHETTMLQTEQLSLLKQLGGYSVYFSRELENLQQDQNDNFNNSKKDNEVLDSLKAEIKLLLGKNENLITQMAKQGEEYKSSSKEQQVDIEKLTREVQNFNISRRKLERELLQMTKQKHEHEMTIASLREDMKTMKDSYEAEMQKLSNMNDQVSQENIELVEKGKEATESLKIALHQLTEEKNAIQMQRKSSSGKDIREIEASLERAKKEREAFRQRCEKSEILQRNLQEEISSLKQELLKEKQLVTRSSSHKEIVNGASDRLSTREKSTSDDGGDSLESRDVERAHSRISQLKKYVHVLEDRIKEKDETILSLRKENARANDVVMEKSLELSKSRRILERKIEKLTNENSELRRRLLNPSSYSRSRGSEETGSKQQQGSKQQLERSHRDVFEGRQRRRSNPERSAIETTLKRFTNEKPPLDNDASTGTISISNTNRVKKPDSGDKDSAKSTLTVPLDVTPRRRIGGKFIRASSKRHSADLGKLMSRPEPVISRRSDSDMLHEDEPATIFVNKYRKKSEEEEHWV